MSSSLNCPKRSHFAPTTNVLSDLCVHTSSVEPPNSHVSLVSKPKSHVISPGSHNNLVNSDNKLRNGPPFLRGKKGLKRKRLNQVVSELTSQCLKTVKDNDISSECSDSIHYNQIPEGDSHKTPQGSRCSVGQDEKYTSFCFASAASQCDEIHGSSETNALKSGSVSESNLVNESETSILSPRRGLKSRHSYSFNTKTISDSTRKNANRSVENAINSVLRKVCCEASEGKIKHNSNSVVTTTTIDRPSTDRFDFAKTDDILGNDILRRVSFESYVDEVLTGKSSDNPKPSERARLSSDKLALKTRTKSPKTSSASEPFTRKSSYLRNLQSKAIIRKHNRYKSVNFGKFSILKKVHLVSKQHNLNEEADAGDFLRNICPESPPAAPMFPKQPDYGRPAPREAMTLDSPKSGAVPGSPSIRLEGTGLENSVIQHGSRVPNVPSSSEIFRFDSYDKERYLCQAISEENEDVFSPGPQSPTHLDSPHLFHSRSSTDSPKLSISPLRIKEPSIDEDDADYCRYPLTSVIRAPPKLSVQRHESEGSIPTTHLLGCRCRNCNSLDPHLLGPSLPHSPSSSYTSSSPHTPLTPISPASGQEYHCCVYPASTLYRRRSHSDSDLQLWDQIPPVTRESVLRQGRNVPRPLPTSRKGGSLESDNSTPQDSPLDLSMRTGPYGKTGSTSSSESAYYSSVFMGSNLSSPRSPSLMRASHTPPPPPRSPGAPEHPRLQAPHTSPLLAMRQSRDSVALRYHLEVSPVVEEMQQGPDGTTFVCTICGQSFSLHDRLAKHVASRHKTKQIEATSKVYMCDICKRSFARSDMLTRHMRLHTGVKPYTCRVCGQIFSRSDHLSTHQRTHTGEKPYKCPKCPYAACRRDMITRHLKTHARYQLQEGSSSSMEETTSSLEKSSSMEEQGDSSRPALAERSLSDDPSSAAPSFTGQPPPAVLRRGLVHQKQIAAVPQQPEIKEQEPEDDDNNMTSPTL